MDYPLCERRGFDTNAVDERLRMLDLHTDAAREQGRLLQAAVIQPHRRALVDRFFAHLQTIEQFRQFATDSGMVQQLAQAHEHYLGSLGVDIHQRRYFEERLRIGEVHQRIGVQPGLYQCTLHRLQQLLIAAIPRNIRDDGPAFDALLDFILRIMALDMSLAVESYCSANVSDLVQTLADERGETERLRKLATTDWLTGLHNHSHSRHYLETALSHAILAAEPLCVIMADLDHFKAVNDTLGHLAGDEVLRIVAHRLAMAARANDEVGRYGGEEFLLVLRNTDGEEGVAVAERIRTRISRDDIHAGGTSLRLTISLGLAEAGQDDTVNTLLARADAALYAAKKAGRDCVRLLG
jgi:diguanylate cyclase (GGDEF)-like protein